MKRFIFSVVILLAVLGGACSASAQCWHPNYSSYVSYSANPPSSPGGSYTVYKTTTVTGTTTIDMYCPLIMSVHCARVTNQIGDQGGVTVGGCVCPTCYMNYAPPTASINSTQTGLTWGDVSDTELICSTAGQFYDSGVLSQYAEFAYTQSKFLYKDNCTTSKQTGITYCDYEIGSWCTIPTTPPDLNPRAVEGSDLFPDPSFYDIYGLGFRFSTSMPFIFLNIDTYAYEVYGPRNFATCTKY